MKVLGLVEMEKLNGGVTACEKEASNAGLTTLVGSITAGAAGAIFTGGLSVVVGVVAGAFSSAAVYAVTYATCEK
ncbi:MAG: hypothetical protein ORN54_11855 [Cyclobacteriaceae bacterium]|nr:hypothetical protein [Cyclobacteriaceae bacterium]